MKRTKKSPEFQRPPGRKTSWPRWTGFDGKTLWDWLLLISALAVPVMVGIAGFVLTWQQEKRQEDLEDQRLQDTALQAYLDNMSTLLIDEHGAQLRKLDPDEEVLDLIQARTETVFAVLDADRQVSVVLFLARAQLILKDSPVINFERVNLQDIDLADMDLSNTSFKAASLEGAELARVNLSGSNLADVDLANAELPDANLRGADLEGANLAGANLEGADFTSANLDGARVIARQLHTTRSLQGAIMPDGREYEDWLKDNPVPASDSDGDGLPDVREDALGLDPQNPDSDGDGILDGDEVNGDGAQERRGAGTNSVRQFEQFKPPEAQE